MSTGERPGPETDFQVELDKAYDLQVGGKWIEAVAILNPLIEREGITGPERASALNDRGVNLRMLSNYQGALVDFRQARQLAQASNDLDIELTALAGIIDLYRIRISSDSPQNLEFAKKYQKTAEAIIKNQGKPTLGTANAYSNFGLLSRETGVPKEALAYYLQAEKIVRDLLRVDPNNKRYKNRFMRVLTIKGVAQSELGQFDEAIKTQNEVLKGCREIGERQGIMNAELSLAETYKAQGNLDEALRWCQKAANDSPGHERADLYIQTMLKELQEKLQQRS